DRRRQGRMSEDCRVILRHAFSASAFLQRDDARGDLLALVICTLHCGVAGLKHDFLTAFLAKRRAVAVIFGCLRLLAATRHRILLDDAFTAATAFLRDGGVYMRRFLVARWAGAPHHRRPGQYRGDGRQANDALRQGFAMPRHHPYYPLGNVGDQDVSDGIRTGSVYPPVTSTLAPRPCDPANP